MKGIGEIMKCPHCGSTQVERRREITPLGKALLVSGVIAITVTMVTQVTETLIHSIDSAFDGEFAMTVLLGVLFCVVGKSLVRRQCRCRACHDVATV